MKKNTERLNTWQEVNEVRKNCEAALKEVAQRYGLDSKTISFAADAEGMELKFDLSCRFENGMPASFERLAPEYHLAPSDWNKKFRDDQGREYRLVGINPKARKRPFVIICTQSGKEYRYGPKIPLQKIGGYRLKTWSLKLR